MNPQPLIGISGRKRSGKDTIAEYLRLQWGFTRLAFADPIKQHMAELDPIIDADSSGGVWRLSDELENFKTDADPTGWEGAKADDEVRRLLQVHGNSTRQLIGDNVWIDATMRQVHPLLAEGKPVVIPDVRYRNEAERVINMGGAVIRVERPALNKGTAATDLHISETDLDEFEHFATVLINDGTIEQLRQAAEDYITHDFKHGRAALCR